MILKVKRIAITGCVNCLTSWFQKHFHVICFPRTFLNFQIAVCSEFFKKHYFTKRERERERERERAHCYCTPRGHHGISVVQLVDSASLELGFSFRNFNV